MDILKQEIAKKKLQIKNLSQNGSRYVTQKEIHNSIIEQKRVEQTKLDESRKRKQDEVIDNENTVSKKKGDMHEAKDSSDEIHFSIKEVNNQLRLLGEPITYFGENDTAKRDRLKVAIEKNLENESRNISNKDDDDFRLNNKRSSNQVNTNNNDNQDQDDDGNDDDDDDDFSEDERHKNESSSKQENKTKKSKFDINQTVIYSKIPNLSKEKMILKYFKSLLKIWEHDLKTREENIKISSKGQFVVFIKLIASK